NAICGSRNYRTLNCHNDITTNKRQTSPNVSCDPTNIGNVYAGVFRRGAHGDHDDFSVNERRVQIVSHGKPACKPDFRKQLHNSPLMEKHVATTQCFKPLWILLDADDLVADPGKAKRGHKTNISRADDHNLHERLSEPNSHTNELFGQCRRRI